MFYSSFQRKNNCLEKRLGTINADDLTFEKED